MKNADLDALFKKYLLCKLNETGDTESLEDALPDLYLQWLQMPNDALGGIAPGAYFCGADAQELVDLLISAVGAGKKPSDPLLDAIVDKPSTEPLLLDLLRGNCTLAGSRLAKARCEAADLLNQMGSQHALSLYFDILKDEKEDEVLQTVAADGIAAQGETAKEALFAALNGANENAAQIILDLLCSLNPDERTYQNVLARFHEQPDRRAFYAELFARCGDVRAVEPLKAALRGEGYYTYTAIRNAIEALGGAVDYDPDFSGDSDYEIIKGYDDTPRGDK